MNPSLGTADVLVASRTNRFALMVYGLYTMPQYRRSECLVFKKVNEPYGSCSNMAGGYPIVVNGVTIKTTEALYQACRFPDHPAVQKQVIGEASPMAAKMVTKPHRHLTRPDWETDGRGARVDIMWWCLQLKLMFHWGTFGTMLREMEDKPIVEESKRDDYWGAIPQDEERLAGKNVLGLQIMALRLLARGPVYKHMHAPSLPNFLLYNRPIEVVSAP